jgi:hypothetical protein
VEEAILGRGGGRMLFAFPYRDGDLAAPVSSQPLSEQLRAEEGVRLSRVTEGQLEQRGAHQPAEGRGGNIHSQDGRFLKYETWGGAGNIIERGTSQHMCLLRVTRASLSKGGPTGLRRQQWIEGGLYSDGGGSCWPLQYSLGLVTPGCGGRRGYNRTNKNRIVRDLRSNDAFPYSPSTSSLSSHPTSAAQLHGQFLDVDPVPFTHSPL